MIKDSPREGAKKHNMNENIQKAYSQTFKVASTVNDVTKIQQLKLVKKKRKTKKIKEVKVKDNFLFQILWALYTMSQSYVQNIAFQLDVLISFQYLYFYILKLFWLLPSNHFLSYVFFFLLLHHSRNAAIEKPWPFYYFMFCFI